MLTRTTSGTTLGERPEPRLRERTGTPTISRSIGAGAISITTVALCAATSRTDESVTPTVTTSLTRSCLPSMSTGSVVAAFTSLTWLSGPSTCTVGGSDEIRPTTKPAAGSPLVAGRMGMVRLIDFSTSRDRVGGNTWATSTPYGT